MTKRVTPKRTGVKTANAGKKRQPAKSPTPSSKDKNGEKGLAFPVVALGASAGGLDALTRFFSNLPPDNGMAFVVVQHLSPKQDSLLSNLLGKVSTLEVVTAEDNVAIAPNTVYVIPPNRYLTQEGGRLHLYPPEGSAHPQLPIDHFFLTLAEEMAERAVAIVLSGSGKDGSVGLASVKAQGGLTIAQEPGSAQYSSMPESAIATNAVDLVLPPEQMGEEILRYTGRRGHDADKEDDMSDARQSQWLAPIFATLRLSKGHDFSQYKSRTVLRRVGRRMAVHGIQDTGEYAKLLRNTPSEVDILFQELLIRVSGFFRDTESFKTLEETVIPALFENTKSSQSIRVWVPGCSTGEEAYSIAMLLEEHMSQLTDRYRVQIFATDIDSAALEIARTGHYPATIEADVSEARLRRFFAPHDGGYRVAKSLRDMLVFAEQSLIKDPPFSRMDLVSCRNVLIYIQPELQKRILTLFHYALNAGGFLFLGSSETVGSMDDLFTALPGNSKIYQRQDAFTAQNRRRYAPFLMAPFSSGRSRPAPTPTDEPIDIAAFTDAILLRDHTPPCVVINEHNDILYFHGPTDRFLAPPKGVPTTNLVRMARPGLESALRTAAHQARAHGRTIQSRATDPSGNGFLRIVATPLNDPRAPKGLVLLLAESAEAAASTSNAPKTSDEAEDGDTRMHALQLELEHTKEALQATIEELETANEELQSSNEELQSSNEELQSSNEELETSREELQSINEELQTVNAELESKVEELSHTNDDMNNLLASTAIGMIFLDRGLQVQRFTPAVKNIIPLIDADVGRPLTHIKHKLDYEGLTDDLQDVLDNFVQREREVRTSDGDWYLLRMRPYRTQDDRVGGVVLAFMSITEKRQLESLRKLSDALDLCPSMALITDREGRIAYANQAFTETTGWTLDPSQPISLETLGLAPTAGEDWQNAWRILLGGGKWSGDMRLKHKDQSLVEASAFAAGMAAQQQNATHVVFYLTDS